MIFYEKIHYYLKNIVYFLILFLIFIFTILYLLKIFDNNLVPKSSNDRVDSYIPYGAEAYLQYEKVFNVKLLRNKNGVVDFRYTKARNNQIDAFRHAYVSGVFAKKYGKAIAKIFGNCKEFWDDIFYNQTSQEKNMDYWNNSIGRRYGIKSDNYDDLALKLKIAIDNKELIIDINDKRIFK